jgi:hypothetical protein
MVESVVSKGTTFHIHLPLEREKGKAGLETSISFKGE